MEFTYLKLPPSIDPNLIAWSAGRRRPSRFCALCGAPFGELSGAVDDGELLVWKEDGACARFCARCMARHWGMRAEPTKQPATRPRCAKLCSPWRRTHGKCACTELGLLKDAAK